MSRPKVTFRVLTTSEAEGFSRGQIENINRLLSQLGTEEIRISKEQLIEAVRWSRVVVATSIIAGQESIVGLACLAIIFAITGRNGCITHIVVDESRRREGIATRILACLIDEARRLSLRRLDLTSRASRAAAQNFWQKNGFVQRATNNFRLELT